MPVSGIAPFPFFSSTKQVGCTPPVHAGASSLAAAGSSENSAASGLGSSLGASLERPGTSLRGGGRVAMTVLRPQQQKASTALPQLAAPQQGQEAQAGPERGPRRSLRGVKNVSINQWSMHADSAVTVSLLFMCIHCLSILFVY